MPGKKPGEQNSNYEKTCKSISSTARPYSGGDLSQLRASDSSPSYAVALRPLTEKPPLAARSASLENGEQCATLARHEIVKRGLPQSVVHAEVEAGATH